MDFTGVRWRLTGAEAILKPRTIRANGDWTDRLLAITTSLNNGDEYTNPATPPVPSQGLRRMITSLQESRTHIDWGGSADVWPPPSAREMARWIVERVMVNTEDVSAAGVAWLWCYPDRGIGGQ